MGKFTYHLVVCSKDRSKLSYDDLKGLVGRVEEEWPVETVEICPGAVSMKRSLGNLLIANFLVKFEGSRNDAFVEIGNFVATLKNLESEVKYLLVVPLSFVY
jgi:hypothetical protein